MKFTKSQALNSWNKVNEVLDIMDWSGKLTGDDLNTVEVNMSILYEFLQSIKEAEWIFTRSIRL